MVVSDSLGFQRGNLSKLRWFVPGGQLFGLEADLGTPVVDEAWRKLIAYIEEKSLYLIGIGALVSYAGHASDSPLKMTLMLGGGILVLLGITPFVVEVVKDL